MGDNVGDNSLKTQILEIISDLDKGIISEKNVDKEILQLYKSKIKLLPHEFLFLMANSDSRIEVMQALPKFEIHKDKKRIR